MISVEEAQTRILAGLKPIDSELEDLVHLTGRVAAEDEFIGAAPGAGHSAPQVKRRFGTMAGKIDIAEDFDQPSFIARLRRDREWLATIVAHLTNPTRRTTPLHRVTMRGPTLHWDY